MLCQGSEMGRTCFVLSPRAGSAVSLEMACGVDGGEQARGDTKEPEQNNGGGCALKQG